MSFTSVKRLNGTSVIVRNTTVEDSSGATHTVANDALNSAGALFTVFSASIEVNPIKIVSFRLSDSLNRMFRL